MVAGLILTGAALAAGAAVGVGAVGLGIAAAHRVGTAYDRTVEQMYEQQSMANYYNQQAYHSSSGRSYQQYQPSGYYPSRYSYGYGR